MKEIVVEKNIIVNQIVGVDQIPADWNQADETKPDFIKNKPTILNAPVWGGVTGDIADQTDLSLALAAKVDKVAGKGLSEADITATEKTAITHSNKSALDLVSGTNTGDQDLSGLVPKVAGKSLSTNDYTTIEKNKLAGIEAGAEVNAIPTWNSVIGKPTTFQPEEHTHSGMVFSSTITEIVTLTQTAYDEPSPKVATTLYVITGA